MVLRSCTPFNSSQDPNYRVVHILFLHSFINETKNPSVSLVAFRHLVGPDPAKDKVKLGCLVSVPYTRGSGLSLYFIFTCGPLYLKGQVTTETHPMSFPRAPQEKPKTLTFLGY